MKNEYIRRNQLYSLLLTLSSAICSSSKVQKYKIALSKLNKIYFSFLQKDYITRKNKRLHLQSSLESLKQFFIQFCLIQFLLFL